MKALTRHALLIALACVAPVNAWAHPHIIATTRMHLEPLADGRLALKMSWMYDPGFSSFTMLQAGILGAGPSPEKLAAIAEEQIKALQEYQFFTKAAVEGAATALGKPDNYRMIKTNEGSLRLEFTLPLEADASNARNIHIELFDPEFFAYFALARDQGATIDEKLGSCEVAAASPEKIDLTNTRSVPKAFWEALDGSQSSALQFKTIIDVRCP